MAADLEMYMIYGNPKDFPGRLVVRRYQIIGGEALADREPLYVGTSLTAARDVLVQMGLTNIGREPGDEPQIVETWV